MCISVSVYVCKHTQKPLNFANATSEVRFLFYIRPNTSVGMSYDSKIIYTQYTIHAHICDDVYATIAVSKRQWHLYWMSVLTYVITAVLCIHTVCPGQA